MCVHLIRDDSYQSVLFGVEISKRTDALEYFSAVSRVVLLQIP